TLAKLRLVQSYRMMNDLKTAKAKLDGFYPCCTSCCNKAFATENFRILFLDRQYDTCLRFLSGNKALDETTIAGFKAAALLMQHNWKEACKLTKDFTSANPPNIRMAQLREIAEKGESIRYKDPYLAATFSGIIPGSGKLYAGQWKDGLYSFLVVSALSYITYRSFEKSSTNPYGFIFGTMAFSFHTANIFGSFKSAVRQNRMKNQNTVREVDKLIFEE
ncbi:MAG TPA: hypothetical protein VK152_11525, partial [Paludibacter sp.]|nr:hypothetical protein [Paludibacter sp.]